MNFNIIKYLRCVAIISCTFFFPRAGLSQFYLEPNFNIAVGDFASYRSSGIGGMIGYEGILTKKLDWMVSAGVTNINGKQRSIVYYGPDYVNLRTFIYFSAGIKYYLNHAQDGLYISGNFGTYYYKDVVTEQTFGMSLGLGYRVGKFDFNSQYSFVQNNNFLKIIGIGFYIGRGMDATNHRHSKVSKQKKSRWK